MFEFSIQCSKIKHHSGCVCGFSQLSILHNHDQNIHTSVLPAKISHSKIHSRRKNRWHGLCGTVDCCNGTSDFRVQARRALLELLRSRKLRQSGNFLYCCCSSQYPDRRDNALHAPSNDLAFADVSCSEDRSIRHIHDWCIVSTFSG